MQKKNTQLTQPISKRERESPNQKNQIPKWRHNKEHHSNAVRIITNNYMPKN